MLKLSWKIISSSFSKIVDESNTGASKESQHPSKTTSDVDSSPDSNGFDESWTPLSVDNSPNSATILDSSFVNSTGSDASLRCPLTENGSSVSRELVPHKLDSTNNIPTVQKSLLECTKFHRVDCTIISDAHIPVESNFQTPAKVPNENKIINGNFKENETKGDENHYDGTGLEKIIECCGGSSVAKISEGNNKNVISTQGSHVKSFKDIPGPWPSLPIIGTGWQYMKWFGRYSLPKMHESNLDKFLRYGPIVKEEFQWRCPVIHVFRPEDFETVLRNQGKYPIRPINEFIKYYRMQHSEKYTNAGLANTIGFEWYQLRKTLDPVLLKLKSMDGTVAHQNDIANDFAFLLQRTRNSDTGRIENIQLVLYKLALESICMLCLDSRLGCLDPDLKTDSDAYVMIEAAKTLFEAFHELYYGLPLWKWFETSSYRKLDEAESAIYKSCTGHIKEALQRVQDRNINGDLTVLDTLVRLENFSEKEILVTVIDLIAGGIYTVTNTLCFLLHHLAKNPDIQQKVYEEVLEKAPDGEIDPSRLKELKYIKACINETFRVTPTVPCLTRILPKDVILSGYNVPAGVPIFCHFNVACQLPKYFEDPNTFMPERWMRRTQAAPHPFAIQPFGFGKRMCAGRHFSEMELCIAVAKIVYNFELDYVTGQEDLDLIQAFIVVPSKPVSLIIRDR